MTIYHKTAYTMYIYIFKQIHEKYSINKQFCSKTYRHSREEVLIFKVFPTPNLNATTTIILLRFSIPI